MKLKLSPAVLRGTVTVPASKSLMHRQMICAWLVDGTVPDVSGGDDVAYTANALRRLTEGAAVIDCGMSGATLRLLLPLCMALGKTGVTFTGAPRLLQRPVPGDLPAERTLDGWRITAALRPGTYRLRADLTSQVISGMLLALPLLDDTSDIMLISSPVSRPYLDMTCAVMAHHGVEVEPCDGGYHIPAPQTYVAADMEPEGDWSAACWYAVWNACSGNAVTVTNCVLPSLQGDARIVDYVNQLPEELPLSDTPDLLPALALLASLRAGKRTRFTRVGFLRGKESDRLESTAEILNALGGRVTVESDGLTVEGVTRFRGGGSVDSHGDHRMAMLAAFAALFCDAPITLTGAESVTKSYREFWRHYGALGGLAEEVQL